MPLAEIAVRTPKGTTIVELPSLGFTVAQLKEHIEDKDSILATQQRLLYLGRALQDHELVDALNVQEHTPIYCFDLGARSSTPSASSSALKTAKLPALLRIRVEFEDEGTLKVPTLALAPRDLVYHVKVQLKNIFKIRVQDQELQVGGTGAPLENGRRLHHYLKQGLMAADGPTVMKLTFTGLIRRRYADWVQLFVRTLTGYVRFHRIARGCRMY